MNFFSFNWHIKHEKTLQQSRSRNIYEISLQNNNTKMMEISKCSEKMLLYPTSPQVWPEENAKAT